MRAGSATFLAAIVVLGAVGVCTAEPAPPSSPESPEDVIRLPEVTVAAPARLPGSPLPLTQVPASVQVITHDELRASGITTLQEALTRLPGVTLNDQQGNSSQFDLSFRGFQATPVTGVPQGVSVFVDGVRVNEPTVEEVNFDLLPLDDIERIELIRGPDAVFGRNTLGGAINIVTRRGAPVREVEAEASGGSFGRQKYRARLGGAEGPFDYYIAISYFSENGWRDESAAHSLKVFSKGGLRTGGTDATLSFQYAENRIEQPGSLPLSELQQHRTLNFTGGDFFKPHMYAVTTNVRQELGERWALAVNAFWRYLDAEQFNVNLSGPNTRSFTRNASVGGGLEVTRDARILGRQNRLVSGVDYIHHNSRVKVFEEEEDGTREVESDVRDYQHAFGVYLQDTLETARDVLLAGDSLVLTAAVRWDWLRHDIEDRSPSDRPDASGVHTFSRANPRFGINYNISGDLGVYFVYSEGFRAPAFLELTCAGPAAICPGLQAGVAQDPPLDPVKARNYEVGVRGRRAGWLEGELTFYRTDVRDDIFAVTPTGTTGLFFQNVGNTRRQGLEAALRITPFRPLTLSANYTLTDATFRDDIELATPRLTAGCAAPPCTQPVRAGNELPLTPRHRVGAGLDYRLTDWLTLWASMQWVGAQRLRGDEENVERELSPYTVVNAGLRARWKGFTGFVTINNVLNEEYETFGTFAPNAKAAGTPIEPFLTPAAPINVVGGLSYRF